MDALIRRVLEKLGGTLDAKMGNDGLRQLGLKLSSMAQRAVEESHRAEDGRRVAPHAVTLVLPFQLHSELGDPGRTGLIEIVTSVLESFIRDRRFVTLAPIRVEVASDLFRDSPTVRTGFDEAPVVAGAAEKSFRLLDAGGRELLTGPVGKGVVIRVGRARDNSLSIEDSSISKYHATISITTDGRMTVQDLGSTNGTFIGNPPTQLHGAVEIQPNSGLVFGEVRVTVEIR
jgi:FHA domain